MEEAPNIHRSVAAICRKLGLVPKDVGRLDIYPNKVTAEVYLLDEGGSKYVTPEGDVALEIREFKVRA